MRTSGFNRILKAIVPSALIRFRGLSVPNRIALTFDDGPVPGVTDRVIQALTARGHQATFFLMGRKAELRPGLINSIIESGCEVGNHFYTHAIPKRLSYSQVKQQLDRTDRILHRSAGEPSWVRPPGGRISWPLLWHLQCRKVRSAVILWSVFVPSENQKSAKEITDTLRADALTAGDIVLLHDDRTAIVDALPGILDLLDERGLHSVCLTELLSPTPRSLPQSQEPNSARLVS